jgi:ribonuclease E
VPRVYAPKADAPKPDAPKADAPKADVPKVDAPAPPAAVDQSATRAGPKLDAEFPTNLAHGQPSEPGVNAADKKQPPAADAAKPGTDGSREAEGVDTSDPSTVSKAAQRIPTAQPETLQAPEQDIQ